MDLTKVLFGEDSDNEKDGTHSSSSSSAASYSSSSSFSTFFSKGSTYSSGSANNGGGSCGDDGEENSEVADGSNTADSQQHDDGHHHEYRDLFACDNVDYSKTLAKSSHPIPVEGVYVIKKDLEDTLKIDEEIDQEKVTKGQVINEVIDNYLKVIAMAETKDEFLERKKQLNDFLTREEERIASESNEKIKLLKAEFARKESESERELISKNLDLLIATMVSKALHLHSLKIKIQASNESASGECIPSFEGRV